MSNNLAGLVKKGDVVWVPYRRDPLWPALVQNVYPKKLTYIFFPLTEEPISRTSTFSCSLKACYALLFDENLGENVKNDLREAYQAACKYLEERGMEKGCDLRSRHDEDQTENLLDRKRKPSMNRTPSPEAADMKKIKEEIEIKSEENYDYNEIASCSTTTTDSTFLSDAEVTIENQNGNGKDKETPKSLLKLRVLECTNCSESPSVTPSKNGKVRSRTSSISFQKKSKDMMVIMNENLESWFLQMWETNRVKNYTQPKREGLSITFKNNLLTTSDFDDVVDRLVQMVRNNDPTISLITSLHITNTIILPHCMVSCWAKYKSVPYEKAMRAYNNNYKKTGQVLPQNFGGLEELCRIACKEREALIL